MCIKLTSLSRRYRPVLLLSAVIVTCTFLTYTCTWCRAVQGTLVQLMDKAALRPNVPSRLCQNCFNFTYNYVINNTDACQNESIYLLMIVTSHHANLDARRAIRKTWGSVTEHLGKIIKLVFVFGMHKDKNFNNQLQIEQKQHHDIVQADFEDNYNTLTQKSVMALKWATTHCESAKYILKSDDDSFNMPARYVEFLLSQGSPALFVGGYCFTVRPDRREYSKWHVPASMYPDSYYPVYCSGPAYVLSHIAARKLVAISRNIIYLVMEDVFMTGLCRHAVGLEYTQITGIQAVGKEWLTNCDLATWLVNTHNVNPPEMEMLWNRAMSTHPVKGCLKQYAKRFFVLLVLLLVWSRLLFSMLIKSFR